MATPRWLGKALAIAQVETITIANTWAAADTATVTINGRDIIMTVGTTATTTEVATQLAAVLNSATSTLGTAYSANERGPNVAEFREFTAAASGSTVVLTGTVKGRPFTVTTSEVTAGTGTATTATTIAATGPNHFDNAKNWSTGAVPVDSDDIVFDSGNVDCKYGMSQAAVTPASITITKGYTGKIGLRKVNQDDASYIYAEYRTRFLTLGGSGDALNTAIRIGDGDGDGSGMIKIASGTGQVTMNIVDAGLPEFTDEPAIEWTGTHASNVVTTAKAKAAFALTAGETTVIATLNIGYRENVAGDADVYCGAGVTLTTVNQSGGRLTMNSNVVTVNVTDGELIHVAGTMTTLNLDKGEALYRSTGTLTTLNVGSGGVIDFRQDMRARTVTNCDLYEKSELHDPYGTVTFTNGIDLVRCQPADVVLDIPAHKRITLGSVA